VVDVSYLLQNTQEIGLRLGQHLQMLGLSLAMVGAMVLYNNDSKA
jgi:hypothetical protein